MGKTVKSHRNTIIYTLADPTTGEIRYIGKTVNSLRNRLTGHLYSIKTENNHRTNWIGSLLKKGIIPQIEFLDESPWSESQELEIYWIAQFKEWGFRLVNCSTGGEGGLGVKRSKEAIVKLKKSLREQNKDVYQYSLRGEFLNKHRSCADASEFIGGRRENISHCCLFLKKSHKGYIWSYLSPEEIDLTKYVHKKRSGNKTETNNFVKLKKSIVITNLKTGEEIIATSIKEASDLTGVGKPGICEECKGRRKTIGDYKFKYK